MMQVQRRITCGPPNSARMKLSGTALLIGCALLTGCGTNTLEPPATTTPAQWQQTAGPGGGRVSAFAVSGTNLFAATSSAVFRSTDDGVSWTAANRGLTGSVRVLAANRMGLFGAGGRGVFRS